MFPPVTRVQYSAAADGVTVTGSCSLSPTKKIKPPGESVSQNRLQICPGSERHKTLCSVLPLGPSLRGETSVEISSVDPMTRKRSCKVSIFVSLSSLGEILAISRIDEARVGASELPKRPAEDIENDILVIAHLYRHTHRDLNTVL